MTEKQKMMAGELYDSSDDELRKERLRAREFLYDFNLTRPSGIDKRNAVIKQLINTNGTFTIEPPFYCDYGYNIEVGDNFYANFGCTILDVNKVIIEHNVLVGPHVQIYTATHPLDPEERLTFREYARPVTIGNNVWIGGGAIICPGVHIGNDTTIGAGSVVTRTIPDGVLAAGNPCRVIRSLPRHS